MSVLDRFRIDDRVAVVTGGVRGLGWEIAQALAEAGAHVALTSRDRAAAEQAAENLRELTGRTCVGVVVDVTHAEQVDAMAATIRQALGPIDILVNNAGVNIRGPLTELTVEQWEEVIRTNLTGPFFCSRAVAGDMLGRGWGRVINLGSILSTISIPDRTPYASSKGGLLQMTRTLALEWADKGVTVNAICPGPFATEMNRVLLDDAEKYRAFVAKIPMGRWGELEEIGPVAVFLASEAASYITGAAIYIDGGWTAQ